MLCKDPEGTRCAFGMAPLVPLMTAVCDGATERYICATLTFPVLCAYKLKATKKPIRKKTLPKNIRPNRRPATEILFIEKFNS